MNKLKRSSHLLGLLTIAAIGTLSQPSYASNGAKSVTLKGELMDTWCYVSQVMGPHKVVIGSSHHVCAVWCAAGGIPVGLLDSDSGEIYMILSVEGDGVGVANEKLLNIQTHEITVSGTTYELDGLKYLTIDEILDDEGIINLTHEQYGIIPGDARP